MRHGGCLAGCRVSDNVAKRANAVHIDELMVTGRFKPPILKMRPSQLRMRKGLSRVDGGSECDTRREEPTDASSNALKERLRKAMHAMRVRKTRKIFTDVLTLTLESLVELGEEDSVQDDYYDVQVW